MDLELLGTLWRRDEGGSRYSIPAKALSESLYRRAARFERKFQLRDWLESALGLLAGGFFVTYAVSMLPNALGTQWVDHWDWLLLGFACWGLAGVFVRERVHARKHTPCAEDDICTTLKKQNESLRHQLNLMKRLVWWYIAPVSIPMAIIIWRSDMVELKLPYGIFCLAVFGGIVLLNRWYAKRRLLPQLEANEQLLDEATEASEV